MTSIRPILAGDPSRGALSLDTEANVTPGQHVQFFHAPYGMAHLPARAPVNKERSLLQFHREGDAPFPGGCSSSFCVSSEHGYVFGRPGQASWVCRVTGSTSSLSV